MPQVLASTSRVMVSEWVDGIAAVARRTARPDDERNADRADVRPVPVRRAEHGRPAARRPASRATSRSWPTAGSASSTSGWWPGCPTGCRRRWAGSCGSPRRGDAHAGRRPACTPRASSPSDVDAEDLLDYLAPFVEPAVGAGVPVQPGLDAGAVHPGQGPAAPPAASRLQLNLPPSYLLIHRVWTGGLAVLSQLNARAAFGSVLEEFLPGYAEPKPGDPVSATADPAPMRPQPRREPTWTCSIERGRQR